MVTPTDRTEAIEGFVISTASDGATAGDTPSKGSTVEENTGVAVMEECHTREVERRTVEEENRTVDALAGGDTVMGECRTAEGERRTVEESTEGGSIGSAASVPATPAGTPFTPAGSVIEMEIGGLDVSVEHRAMEERGTPASATPPEFPFTPLDMPTETESKGVEDEDAEAVARRLARGKSVVGENDGQEASDPLATPLSTPSVHSSRGQGLSLRDTLEEGPRVTLVQEVEVAVRERAAFSEAPYVPCVHFFVPFGVDAFLPRQSLQEEEVLHDPGSHLGMSGPLVLWNLQTGLQADFLVRSREMTRNRVLLESPFGWQWYLGERVTHQSLGLTEFRVPASVPLFMLRTRDYTREEIERHTSPVEDLTAYCSPSLDFAGYRERYLAYLLRMEERLLGALEGNESEVATRASGSRRSRRGGASSRRRSVRGRGTGRVAEVGHTFPEVPRAWAENVYWLLLDCFMVIRRGAMGVSPEVLPRGATTAAQRGGARRRSSSSGPTGRRRGREESSIREGGRGEA
ncbi:hypothetical protein RHSIM_Rhsim09G0078100 [Rhododendron simsii]|uniref:Uncharacterized protein n=1 Tax=Rhododendron simsii TaxID=118357 RepID=A0A834GJ43_RHOSS|nr:hypothetical protein RHSIM_Rhsim09G0078100 [Rhododendron simsii]